MAITSATTAGMVKMARTDVLADRFFTSYRFRAIDPERRYIALDGSLYFDWQGSVPFASCKARRYADGTYHILKSSVCYHRTRQQARRRAERLAGKTTPWKESEAVKIAENEGRCAKCKVPRLMVESTVIESNGRYRLAGKCGECGTKMSKFVKPTVQCPSCEQPKPRTDFENDYICYECRYG